MNPGPDGPTRVAVLGTGRWGEQHARVFAAHPDAELVAVVGRNAGRAQARAEKYHTRAYTQINSMLIHERPDLVSVCLPNEEHFEPTLHLLHSGVGLLVEKPLVFDLDQADALLAEATRRETFFAINFNHRYARPVQLAAEAIRTGRLGEIVFARWRFGGEPGGGTHPHRNLIETQCHGFDQLEWLVGPISSVAAQMRTDAAGNHPTMSIALAFDDGAVGSMLGTYDASYSQQRTHPLEIDGTEGRLLVDDTVQRFAFSRHGSTSTEVWRAGYFDDAGRSFAATVDGYVDDLLVAFRAGTQPPVPASAGRRALQLAWASIESFSTRRHVETPFPTPGES